MLVEASSQGSHGWSGDVRLSASRLCHHLLIAAGLSKKVVVLVVVGSVRLPGGDVKGRGRSKWESQV